MEEDKLCAFDIKAILEMLDKVGNTKEDSSSSQDKQIRLFFLGSNSPNGLFFEGNLDNSVKTKIIENIIDFFNLKDLPNYPQVPYDFKGKSNDNTVEVLELDNLPDLKLMIDTAKTESTTDLTNLKFSNIKSIMIILNCDEKELVLLSKLKLNMFLEETRDGGFLSVKKDIIKTADLSEKYIMTPTFYDICVFDDTILLPTHSTTTLNSVIALKSFYQVAINESVALVEESQLISNFEDFNIAVEARKHDKVLQNHFARLNSTKRNKFEALKKQYVEQKKIFLENFKILKSESLISLELDDNGKFIFDATNDAQLIQILTVLMDAYAKTYMLHEVTEQ